MRCAAITRAGDRCRAEATHGSYCWSHAPETAEARKQRASKGGRIGGNGRASRSPRAAEAREIRAELRRMASEVEAGGLDRGAAAVAGQLLNYALGALRVEIKTEEVEELIPRIEKLEQGASTKEGVRGWG
jgi:phage/plasmid-associated DNA primase